MALRRIILNLHLYAGLVAALFLTILGVTGSIMVFEDRIDGWLNPRPVIRPQPERLSLHDLQIRLEVARPGYKVAGFGFPLLRIAEEGYEPRRQSLHRRNLSGTRATK
jgi:uncharacterized iron-regulated membrane protein